MHQPSSPPLPDRALPTLPVATPPPAQHLAVPPPGSVAGVLHRRRHRTSGWTPVRVAAFIEKLGETGSVTHAAAYVGLSTVACYALRNHPDGAPFAAAWDDAVGARHEMLADLALDRVRDGVERARWWKGERIGFDRVYSDRLLMFMLDRTDPQRRAAGGRGRMPAARGDDDPGALDRLLGGPDGGTDGQCEHRPPAPTGDDDPAAMIAAELAAELAAETALTPEDEAMTAAFIARHKARVEAAAAEAAALDAEMDAGIHGWRKK